MGQGRATPVALGLLLWNLPPFISLLPTTAEWFGVLYWPTGFLDRYFDIRPYIYGTSQGRPRGSYGCLCPTAISLITTQPVPRRSSCR